MNAMMGSAMALAPPTARDFDILRMSAVEWASTRAIAAKHHISQTRVRQVVQRTTAWLAQALPVQTELELEQQVRLAQHLAADQLRHQAEQLNNYWNGTGDPKYLRQQTRVVQALARLGVVPGQIEALAADVTVGPEPLDEPLPAWSEDDAFATVQRSARDGVTERKRDGGTERQATFPSDGACSAESDAAASLPAGATKSKVASDCGVTPCEAAEGPDPMEFEGAQLMERRLLTLLDFCGPGDVDRRDQLQRTLAAVRREKAQMELRLSANRPGVEVTTQATHSDSKSAASERQTADQRL